MQENLSANVPVPFGPAQVPAGEVVPAAAVPVAAATPQPPATELPEDAALQAVQAVPDAPPEAADFTVVVGAPHEAGEAQARLIEWCARKIAALQEEADDLGENLVIATRQKWGTGALSRHHKLALRRVEFYRKVKLALEAGFVLIPNFPVEIFAVRTKRGKPKYKSSASMREARKVEAESLPAGEGQFQDAQAPLAEAGTVTRKNWEGKEYQEKVYYPVAFNDTIDFPFVLTKPEVLKATERAMVDKVFDELGVLPGRRPKGDPIVVGRIRDPRGTTYSKRWVTFLVAWFVDTREL